MHENRVPGINVPGINSATRPHTHNTHAEEVVIAHSRGGCRPRAEDVKQPGEAVGAATASSQGGKYLLTGL